MASDRVPQDSTTEDSLVNYRAELIPFPKHRIVRTRATQRKLQERVTRYMVDFDVTAFVAFSTARYKLEGPGIGAEDFA